MQPPSTRSVPSDCTVQFCAPVWLQVQIWMWLPFAVLLLESSRQSPDDTPDTMGPVGFVVPPLPPNAIENTCSPPVFAVPGSVTLATVLPEVRLTGVVAKTYVFTASAVPPAELRYVVVMAVVLPDCTVALPPLSVQSEKLNVTDWVVPSV